ncbi:thioether cross-link-forming SCIFF peptide maturase [Anaerotalea alkaliphila]|uniref:Thioether cross-link-forming SCIFF peptide maturase n=1 Tax=Anaerotalea alkaliphila TaxID=2662126 RepID=A0A7X5KMA1_9FIRM|nr:thioether cross-link-forming SCIFF peptide maturase [Anaerotalea alkaliphila]NDL67594.1 thioether cross-link-forming SCIFF peptide maturase [Anaerotalea alkaliphila]
MIHQYKMNDLNIILDVDSGAVHLVDEETYAVVALLDKGMGKEAVVQELKDRHGEEKLLEVLEEVEELKDKGQLFSEEDYSQVLAGFGDRQTVVKAMCLHIAHDCNLRCGYCFAGEGEYHGDRSMMSAEVGRKAVDFLVENSGSRRNLEIDFFGGEPLMNFGVVKEIVAYAKSVEKEHNKNFRFTITTNGVLLDEEKLAFINEHMYNVVLSIDGRKEVHDRMRPAPNGKGSYDLILPKFKEVAESRGQKNYYVRGTFTRHNLDFSKDVMDLAEQGFRQISVEPVVADEAFDYALREEDLGALQDEYELLAERMLESRKAGKDFNFFHFFIDLNQGPCISKRITGCGAGFEYLAVTPWGDLYPCHQFVGMEEFKMGSLEEGVRNKQLEKEFKGCNVYEKPACTRCWAKFYCSGGCNANSYNFHGSIREVYGTGCVLEKKRVECAIYLKAKSILEEQE